MLSPKNPSTTVTTAAANGQLWVAPQDAAEFEQMQSALTLEFAPATEFQFQCLTTIIHCLWTIRRTRIAECKMQERAFNDGLIDPLLDPDWARQLKGILEMRRQAERSQIQAKKDFYSARQSVATATCSTNPRTGENTSHAAEASTPAAQTTKVIRMPNQVASVPPTSAPTGQQPLNSNCANAVTLPNSPGGVIDCRKVAS
jgi:hypothetical protein